jgi:hypothetical protein
MTLRIPLTAVPSQKLSITLGTQRCTISVYQKTTGLYFDLSVAGTRVVAGMICRNLVNLVRSRYLTGFVGDLAFVDTQGSQDPDYTGLGSRYQLVYLP